MNYAIIVAAGKGERMTSIVPKQFLELDGKPLLYHTVKKFLDFSSSLLIILVLPEASVISGSFKDIYFPGNRQIFVVAGGENRFHSVQNGLRAILEDEGVVFIHDGVRPFVSERVLTHCLEEALRTGNAIPCMGLKDSLRQVDEEGNRAVPRNEYKAIQTPQTFRIRDIKKAFEQDYDPLFTDEASVFEAAGQMVHLVAGNDENIKITTPLDFELAKYLLAKENKNV